MSTDDANGITIAIPPDLANRILQSPPYDDLATPFSLAPSSSAQQFTFPDELRQEVNAHVSCAFSSTVQQASIAAMNLLLAQKESKEKVSVPEPIVALYYPRDGCHDIIDAMVKSVAHEQLADVVVLDPLDFALGEYGPFGKDVSDAISNIYSMPKDSNDDIVQRIFDTIVNVQRVNTGEYIPTKRIIYIRDFSSIAQFSARLIVRLLRGIHARRTTKIPGSNPQDRNVVGHPTVLILGFTRPPESRCTLNTQKKYSNSDTTLRSLLSAGNRVMEVKKSSDALPLRFSPFSSSFFLGSLVGWSDLRDTSIQFKEKFSFSDLDLRSSISSLSLFLTGENVDEIQRIEQSLADRRRGSIGNAWFSACLMRRGAYGPDNALGLMQTVDNTGADDTQEPSQLLQAAKLMDKLSGLQESSLPLVLDRIANAAAGLSQSDSASSPVIVSQTTLSKAYQLVIGNDAARLQLNKKVAEQAKQDSGNAPSNTDTGSEPAAYVKTECKPVDPVIQRVKKSPDLSGHEKKLLGCIIDIDELHTSFEDVCIPAPTTETLRTIVSLPLLFPQAFQKGVLGRESIGGVLLYGPPGTGKTLLCRAVAGVCGARMLYIKPSDIENCYVGESEKLIRAVFSLAYKLAPCLIFIDEVESCFGKRKADDKKWMRDQLSEFLQSMDGLRSAKQNRDAGVIVIGATNRPQDIDEAVLRRLPSRLLVDVPGEADRKRILELHLRGETLDDSIKLDDIARRTTNYSGSDLKNLCVAAAMKSIKEAVGTFSWDTPRAGPKIDSSAKVSSTDGSMTESSSTNTVTEKAENRKITMTHLLQALNEVPPSLAVGARTEFHQWHEQYGGRTRTEAGRTAYGYGYGNSTSTSTNQYGGSGMASHYGSPSGYGYTGNTVTGGYGTQPESHVPSGAGAAGDHSTSEYPHRLDTIEQRHKQYGGRTQTESGQTPYGSGYHSGISTSVNHYGSVEGSGAANVYEGDPPGHGYTGSTFTGGLGVQTGPTVLPGDDGTGGAGSHHASERMASRLDAEEYKRSLAYKGPGYNGSGTFNRASFSPRTYSNVGGYSGGGLDDRYADRFRTMAENRPGVAAAHENAGSFKDGLIDNTLPVVPGDN